MPNKDWYWDRFQADLIQGGLDLDRDQTSALAEKDVEGRIDYTDTQQNQYETRFIDELYGTDNRAWVYPDGGAPNPNAPEKGGYHLGGVISTMGSGRPGKGGNYENPEHAIWGLDLVRDWTGKEHLTVGSDDHYKWQTRGTVDWAHYYDDNAYQKAFMDYRSEKNNYGADDWSNLKDYFTDDSSNKPGSFAKIEFLEWAKTWEAKEEEGEFGIRDDWPNKYEDQFDPETAVPYTPTYLDVPDLWGEAAGDSTWEVPMTPKTVSMPQGIPTLEGIQRTQVKVPGNIQAWGGTKSAPKGKFTPGGGEA